MILTWILWVCFYCLLILQFFGSCLLTSCVSFLGLQKKIMTKWWLKTTEMYSISVVKSRSPKLRCQQDYVLSEGSRGECILCIFLSFWCCQQFSISWLIDAKLQSLPPLSCGILPVCVCVSSPFLIRTPIILDYSPPKWSMM